MKEINSTTKMKIRICLYFILFFLNIGFSFGQTINKQSISGTWKVTWSDGVHGRHFKTMIEFQAKKDPERYIDVPVPMDLNKALQARGILNDPNIGLNSLNARWIGEQYWSYFKTFNVNKAALNNRAWLVFDRLDYSAIIILNGKEIGRHQNAFIPYRIDVSGLLKEGENELTVGIESGYFAVAEKNGKDYLPETMIEWPRKRQWLRKPQYQFGWDWNPVMVNVGITGDVRIEWTQHARIDQELIQATLSEDLKNAYLSINTYIQGGSQNEKVKIRSQIIETNQTAEHEIVISKEIVTETSYITIKNPSLWWPAGQGAQFLYHVKTDVIADGIIVDSKTSHIGIRKVELDQSPHPLEGNYFTVKVNNRKIFCKGSNWIPADMIYSAVTPQKTAVLLDLAEKANFNMLRIWGGGEFVSHQFLDLCDEKGIMVWHDFLFACSKYPGDDLEFVNNVKREITWAVREYTSHPSICVWCGHNEIFIGYNNWGWMDFGKAYTDYGIYLEMIPQILANESVTTPYWPGSPYKGKAGIDYYSDIYGDQHPYEVSLGADGADFTKYRNYKDRFADEGGVMGASTIATIKEFLPENERYVRSFTWEHHDNLVDYWTSELGINYDRTQMWFGKDYKSFSLDDFAFGSSLLQGEGLIEFINNYRRRMFSSSAAVFWMYNDSWPVANGWSIVDYYNRRKLPYYSVRRAFQPVNVVVVEDSTSFQIYGVNDNPTDWTGQLQYGVFETKGPLLLFQQKKCIIKSNSSTIISSVDKKALDSTQWIGTGVFARLLNPDKTLLAQNRSFNVKFKDLAWFKPDVQIIRRGNTAIFKSTVYVWSLSIDLDGEKDLPDNNFDLIPNLEYSIPWPKDEELPLIVKTGNDLFQEKY